MSKKKKTAPQAYMFIAALLLTAKQVEKSRYPSTGKGINKVGYMGSYLATERNEVHATTGSNLKTIMLSEKKPGTKEHI